MSTQPLKTLLDIEYSKVAAREIIEVISPLLRELVNYATNAFGRCETLAKGRENEDLAPLLLYLHKIEMVDGIEQLIQNSSIAPAEILLRSAFEGLLSLQYILEDSHYFRRRSLSWLVFYIHKRMKVNKSYLPDSNDEMIIRESLGETKNLINLASFKDPQQTIDELEELLSKHYLAAINEEFLKQKPFKWYRLFNGPANLRDLAKYIDSFDKPPMSESMYILIYKRGSAITHADDLSRFLDRTNTNDPAIRRLRPPDISQIQQIGLFASTFLINSTRQMLEKYAPSENISQWYMRNIKERYDILNSWMDNN